MRITIIIVIVTDLFVTIILWYLLWTTLKYRSIDIAQKMVPDMNIGNSTENESSAVSKHVGLLDFYIRYSVIGNCATPSKVLLKNSVKNNIGNELNLFHFALIIP